MTKRKPTTLTTLLAWVENHGSIGFTVDFDVSFTSDLDLDGVLDGSAKLLNGFELRQDGRFVQRKLWTTNTTLYSDYCDWLSIPGYDQYSPAFEFTIKGLELHGFVPLAPLPGEQVHSVASSVSVQLYVEVNSNGSLRSMNAWAVDSDGDSYKIPLYYSPGGSDNFRTFED